MKTSIKQELTHHLLELINDGVLHNDNLDEWHFHCFNEDYYIIGYYQAEEWLKSHGISCFEAISTCQEYEIDVFGESTKIYDNAETTVNMLVYIYGEELINSLDCENVQELEDELNKIID